MAHAVFIPISKSRFNTLDILIIFITYLGMPPKTGVDSDNSVSSSDIE